MRILPNEEIDFCAVQVGQTKFYPQTGHLWQCLGCGLWYIGSTRTGEAHTKNGHRLYGGCSIPGSHAVLGVEIEGIEAKDIDEAYRRYWVGHEAQLEQVRALQSEMRAFSDEELAVELPPDGAIFDDQTERQRYADSERIRRNLRRHRAKATT